MSLILEAGGIPVLAHAFLYHFSNEEIRRLIEHLKEHGLGGLEVYHSMHHAGQIAKLREWAAAYDLLQTGGSDFHGTNNSNISIGTGRGSLRVPIIFLTSWKSIYKSDKAGFSSGHTTIKNG